MIIEVPYFKYVPQFKLWLMKNRQRVKDLNIELSVYDGIPGSPWNGGRMPLFDEPDEKIATNFALTNHTITDLEHKTSHEYLERFHSDKNKIIFSNWELFDMLKARYPKYKFIYSITAYDINNGFDGYDEIEKKVDYIVPRNEIVNEGDEFYKRNTSQYILLYSYECSYCPLYLEHYELIGKIVADNDKEREGLVQCWFKDRKLLVEAGFEEDVYSEYKYITSGKFHKKLRAIDPKILAGYKIGRNQQSWEAVEQELNEVVELIEDNQ